MNYRPHERAECVPTIAETVAMPAWPIVDFGFTTGTSAIDVVGNDIPRSSLGAGAVTF